MGSYRWHCSSCCELSAPRGLSASSNCLSAGIPAPLQECTPCAEPEKGLRVQQDAPLKYNAIQIKLDALSSDKPLRTKERKISPFIHCKNILSNCHCSFIKSPFSLASPHAADPALLPPQTNIITHSPTITQHQCQKWRIQTQVATDVPFTDYHNFPRQQEEITSLETLIKIFHSPLCWFSSLNLRVFFWWRRGDKRESFHLVHHFKDARASLMLYDKVHWALQALCSFFNLPG